VYGADAIAGVVNFILKKDFEGFEVNTGYFLTEEEDGQQVGMDLTYGGQFADGRGRAVFSASYYDREAIYKGARSFAAQATSTTGIFPGGSFTTVATNRPDQATVDGLFGPGQCANSGGIGGFGFNPDGSVFCTGNVPDTVAGTDFQVVGYTGPDSDIAQNFFPDFFSYNFEPDNILVLPMERWNIYSNITMDLGDKFQPYIQAIFTNYNALQELAPTPGAGFTVPVNNPFIRPDLAALLAARPTPGANFSLNKRFNALGGRTGYNNHDVWQLIAGTKGDIAGDWSYDVYYGYGRSVQTEIQGGNVRVVRTNQLLSPATMPATDTAGQACLASGGFDPFGDSQLTPACAAYIGLEAKNLTTMVQTTGEAVATGSLFDVPAGPVQAAFGIGWREIDFSFQPDSGLQPGQVVGFNEQLPISGRLDYLDYFTEVSVPIVNDVPGIKALSLTGGLRTTDNNVFGSDETWKTTLDWSVNDSFRVRGGLQHAVRSPNIAELFAPQVNNFPNVGAANDPCNTTGAIATDPLMGRNGANGAAVTALCLAQSAGTTAPFTQPFGQVQALVGGNPGLVPEQADSWSVGFVYQTQSDHPMLQRLTFSLDYVSIELEDVIAAFSATSVLQRCYNREGANPTYDINNAWCQFFERDATGRVIDMELRSQNQAFINTSGIDFTIDWGLSLGGAGDLGFTMIGGWVEKFEQQDNSTTPVYEYTGTVSQVTAGSTPEWKVNLTSTWSLADLQFQHTLRYISSMFHANIVTGGTETATNNTPVPDTFYHDISGSYNLTDKVTLRAGINNVGNQKPRLYVPNVQAGTDPSLYDILGRRFFVSVNARL
jgi:outer membrane receptor protein involved in Fe transport